MKKKRTNLVIFFLTAFSMLTVEAFGFENYTYLKQANQAKDEGRTDDAIFEYNRYITSHPAVQGEDSAPYHTNKQYYIRNLLIAYKNLIQLYRKNKDIFKVDICINQLKSFDLANDFGAKNKYNLALILYDNHLSKDAALIFKEIINEQIKYYCPHNNKVALRSVSKLFKIHQSNGNTASLLSLFEMIKSDFPVSDFDLRDKFTLGSLYLSYGFNSDGITLLEGIIQNQLTSSDLYEINTTIKTYTKLLSHYSSQKNNGKIETLFSKVSAKYPSDILSVANQYKMATTYLNCGKQQEGIRLLKDIFANYADSLYGRKALFLLGRLSQANEDWSAAIQYFSEYVNRYPAPPFFALKAYSRLLDSCWSSSDYNKDLVQRETKTLADIVNNTADYDTQLNLARDFKYKGMDELAAATFNIGLCAAEQRIYENPDTYIALKTHWMIEKYAYSMERFDLVEQNANHIFRLSDNFRGCNSSFVSG